MNEFPKRLKGHREMLKKKDSKWTQRYVASKVGVARVTYTAYENGTKTPPLDIVRSLSDLFGVSIDYLMGVTNGPSNKGQTQRDAIIHKISTEFPNVDLMFKDMEGMSAEELQEVYEFIKFKKSQKENN